MNVIVFGAAGFIGTNLALKLIKKENIILTLVDVAEDYFVDELKDYSNIKIGISDFDKDTNFDEMLANQDVVYHLVSNVVPASSGVDVYHEIESNVGVTAKLLDACVRCNVKKVVFVSSGGTVYGREVACPIKETADTNPITSYGIQKLAIEKLLYFYNYKFGLDYRVIRLANPYGNYQRPNGVLGVIVNFVYKALKKEPITIYGDGSVIRDYIYIDDAIEAILKIVAFEGNDKIFNLGSGVGISIKEVLEILEKILDEKLNVTYMPSRAFDVPVNYLDMSRYEKEVGATNFISLEDGINKTIDYIKKNYLN